MHPITRIAYLGLLTFLLFASPVSADHITLDTVSSTEGTNSTSASHTFAADSNIAIICVSERDEGNAVGSVASVTVGGQAATFLVGRDNGANTVTRVELWYKLAPLTGAQTVVATGAAGTDSMAHGVMSFKNVAQSDTFNTTDSAAGAGTSNMDVDGIPSALGEMVVMCGAIQEAGANNNTVSADGTAPVSTERFDMTVTGTTIAASGYTEDGAATSINMRVDINEVENWSAVAVSMRHLVSAIKYQSSLQ